MASATGSLDYWRKFFRSTNSDIIEVIESAILVATSDCPKELRSRRDQITEKLYSCRNCDRAEQLQTSGTEEEEEEEDGGSSKREGEKESNAGSGSSSDGAEEELNPVVSNYSYNEAEALTEEIEEENQIVGEVLRIKELLANHQDESDKVLFESLRRLQLMDLSVETLKATDIGRTVNGIRRHNSKQIRQLVRTLIEDWKVLVDEWVSATAAIANSSPDTASPADMDEEEGLPSPPMDEGAFLATHTTSIQLSGFFDGIDDDGNFRISREFDENQENINTPPKKAEPERKQQSPEDKGWVRRQEQLIRPTKPLESPIGHAKYQDINKVEIRRQEPVVKQTKPQAINDKQSKHNTIDSRPVRPTKPSTEKKSSVEKNAGLQKKHPSSSQDNQSKHSTTGSGPGRPQNLHSEWKASDDMNAGLPRKPPTALQNKLKNSEEALLRSKLEAAKRKLHENYQQAENAKKQRTIQVMELHDIPKKAHVNRQPILKQKSHIRNLINGRR